MHGFIYETILPYTNTRKFFIALMLVGIWFTILSVCPFQGLEEKARKQLGSRWVKNPLADFLILFTLCMMAAYLLYHIKIVRQDAQIIIDAFLYQVDLYYKNAHTYFSLSFYSTNGSRLLFSGEVLLALFMAKVYSHRNGMFLGTLPVAILVFGGLFLGQVPSMECMILMVGGVLGMQMLTDGTGLGGRKGFEQKKAEIHRDHMRTAAVLILLAMVFSVSACLSLSTKSTYQKWEDAVLRKQHAMEREMVDFTVRTIQNLLTMLGIDQPGIMTNAAPNYTGKTVLTIRTRQLPETDMYLRGFIGSKYENGRWSNSIEQEQTELLCWQTQSQLMEQDFYFVNDAVERGICEKGLFSIEYAGNNRDNFGYLPYFSRINIGYKENFTRNYDWGLRRDSALTDYWFTMPLLSDGLERDLLRNAHLLHQSSEWVPGEFRQGTVEEYWNYVLEQDTWLPEKGLEQTKELAQALLDRGEVTLSEEADVFDNYALQEFIYSESYIETKTGVIPTGSGVAKTIRQLRSFLNSTTSYSQHLNAKPPREDYVENFLFRQKRGYCEHYATAGAVLFRAMGVPARYVSGYKVSPDDFVENGDGTYTAQIPDSAAHAWTEVYTEECGWTVADMTPADQTENSRPARDAGSLLAATEEPEDEFSPEEMGETSQTEKPEETPEIVETSSPEPEEVPETATDMPGSGPGGSDPSVPGGSGGRNYSDYLLGVGISLLSLGLLLFLWRLQMTVRTRRLRRCGKVRECLLEMNRLMEKYLRCCGCRGLSKMTDTDYLGFLKRKYPQGRQELEEYYQILEQARFARDGGQQEELVFCEGLLFELGSHVIRQCSGPRRWYVRWLRNWRATFKKF